MVLNRDISGTLPQSLLKFYLKYGIKNYWFLSFLWMIFAIFLYAGLIVWPYCMRWIATLFEKPLPQGVGFLEYVMPTVILITLLNMGLTISDIVLSTLESHTEPKIKNQISEILTNYVHNQSMSFWVNRMAGSIHSQIGYIEKGYNAFVEVWKIICNVMVISVNGFLLMMLNKYIAVLFVFALAFRILYAYLLRKRVKEASEEQSSASSFLSGKLVDSFSNYSIVKLFAGATKEQEHLSEPRKKMVKTTMFFQYVTRLFWAIPGLLWDLLFGTTVFLCGILWVQGKMNVSEIVYAVSVYFQVMGSIGAIINNFPEIIDMVSAAKKAYKDLVVPIDVQDIENAKKLVVKRGKIEFKNVSFKYRNKYVLRDLFLTIKPGERVGIVGASGAGKTTLVHLLMRFWDPQHGAIFIDNQNISSVTQNSLRENIAFIPQDPTMFNRTIAENIGYGNFDATKSEIVRAAKKAYADKFINETEKKYNSVVGERGVKLSGGQRQRIAIARAFLKNAPILVLDEATSALDSETEIAIQNSFEKLSHGRTTIAIAHRLSTLRNMDRIIVLDKGAIVEQGSHAKLLRKRGLYYHLWQMQSDGFLQEDI